MNRDHSARWDKVDDVALFDALYRDHHRALYAYLMGQCPRSDTAADLLQEAFLRVWKHIETARQIPPDKQRYWLFALARNLALDHRRHLAARPTLQELPAVETMERADRDSDPALIYSAKETRAALDGAIHRLPEDLRTALTLHLLGEMTSEEIGQALGMPAGTVRYRVSQARQRIAQDLGMAANRKRPEEGHGRR